MVQVFLHETKISFLWKSDYVLPMKYSILLCLSFNTPKYTPDKTDTIASSETFFYLLLLLPSNLNLK